MIDFTVFAGVTDNRPAACRFDDWIEFADWLEAESQTEEIAERKSVSLCVSPATYPTGAKRHASDAVSWNWFAADIDNKGGNCPGASIVNVMLKLEGVPFVIYTTTSHRDGADCFRVMFPLDRAVSAAEFPAVWGSIASWIGCIDEQTKDISRLFIVPRRWNEQSAFYRCDSGLAASVDAICLAYAPSARPAYRPSVRASVGDLEGLVPLPLGAANLNASFVSGAALAKARTSPAGGRIFGFLVSTAQRALRAGYAITADELAQIGRELAREMNRPAHDINRDANNALALAAGAFAEHRRNQELNRRPRLTALPARWLKKEPTR